MDIHFNKQTQAVAAFAILAFSSYMIYRNYVLAQDAAAAAQSPQTAFNGYSNADGRGVGVTPVPTKKPCNCKNKKLNPIGKIF